MAARNTKCRTAGISDLGISATGKVCSRLPSLRGSLGIEYKFVMGVYISIISIVRGATKVRITSIRNSERRPTTDDRRLKIAAGRSEP